MLSEPKVIGSSKQAIEYYITYATEQGEEHGVFIDYSNELRIHGKRAEAKQLENLLQGFSPDDRRKLCHNAGSKGHRSGYDLTYSPPKSVSIVWSSADSALRQQIESAQKSAVKASLDFINKYAAVTRTGRNGRYFQKTNLVVATFQHSSNRAGEPGLHTHCLVMNVAKGNRDGKWRTIESAPIFQARMAAGAIYKAELASQLQQLGFKVTQTEHSFEIKGVPEKVCKAQSSRSKDIEEFLAARGLDRSSATARAKEIGALASRPQKGHITRDFSRWRDENTALGFSPKDITGIRSKHDLTPQFDAKKSQDLLRESIAELTTSTSTFTAYDLYRVAATKAIGKLNVKSLERSVTQLLGSKDLFYIGTDLKNRNRYTTAEIFEIERENKLMVARRLGEGKHMFPEKAVDAAIQHNPTMTTEQTHALRHMTQTKDGIVFLTGDAGTGKSFTMKAIKFAADIAGSMGNSSRYTLHGVSLQNSAAIELHQSSGIDDCRSIDSLLLRAAKDRGYITKRSIVILDESGMVDSRKWNALLKLVNDRGAKLIAVGDEKQIQPIYAAQMHGTLTRCFGFSRLSQIFRQKDSLEQQAVASLADAVAKLPYVDNSQSHRLLHKSADPYVTFRDAIDQFDQRGQLKIAPDPIRRREDMVRAWYRHYRENPSPQGALISATTNQEVDALNEHARQRLVAFGHLDQGIRLPSDRGDIHVAVGEQIIFTKMAKKQGIVNSTFAKVQNIHPITHTITAKTELGTLVNFNPYRFKNYRLGYAISAHKSQGKTVAYNFTAFDGYFQDAEKIYVEMSRAKERHYLFADRLTIGTQSFDKMAAIQKLPKIEREEALHNLFKDSLTRILSRSGRKDTTQDYRLSEELQENQKLERYLADQRDSPQGLEAIQEGQRGGDQSYSASFRSHRQDVLKQNQEQEPGLGQGL